MAKYEFNCTDCGADFALELAMSERADAKITCPACGGTHADQVYRAVHINTRKASCDHGASGGCVCGGCCADC